MVIYKSNLSKQIQKVILLFCICFFDGKLFSQSKISLNQKFDIIVEYKAKYLYETDTTTYLLHQKYNYKPTCSNIIYYEYNYKDSSSTYIDSLNNRYLIYDSKEKIAYYKRLTSINQTKIFSPLVYGFDSVMNKYCSIKKTFPFQNQYNCNKDSSGIFDSCTVVVNYDKNNIPISIITTIWMDSMVQYTSLTVKKIFNNEKPCIIFADGKIDSLKIVNCLQGQEKKYDKYENFKTINLSSLLLPFAYSNLSKKFSFKEDLDSLNLVFLFTEYCYPCHLFIDEVYKLLKVLKYEKIKLIAVLAPPKSNLPSKADKKIIDNGFNLLLDSESNFEKKYNINSYPFFLIVDKQGKIIDYTVGYRKDGINDIINFIQKQKIGKPQ